MNDRDIDAFIAERENEAWAEFRDKMRLELDTFNRIIPAAAGVVRNVFLAGYRRGLADGLKGVSR